MSGLPRNAIYDFVTGNCQFFFKNFKCIVDTKKFHFVFNARSEFNKVQIQKYNTKTTGVDFSLLYKHAPTKSGEIIVRKVLNFRYYQSINTGTYIKSGSNRH